MLPVLRAAADQLVFDVAMVEYLSAALPGGAEGPSTNDGCTGLCPAIRHLADYVARFAADLGRFTEGASVPAPECNWASGNLTAPSPPPPHGSMDAIRAAGQELIAAMDRTVRARAAASWDGRPATVVIAGACAHISDHAVDFVDALPRLRDDAFFLNWALWPGPNDSPRVQVRRQSLLSSLHSRSANCQEESRP